MSPVPTPTARSYVTEEGEELLGSYRAAALAQLRILKQQLEISGLKTGTRTVEIGTFEGEVGGKVIAHCNICFNYEEVELSFETDEETTGDSSIFGFICHPRSGDNFVVVRYGEDSVVIANDSRTQSIGGGWSVTKGVISSLPKHPVILYPSIDSDNASLVFTENGKGRFTAEKSAYGNFYYINPDDPTDIITWKATPSRHGALFYGSQTPISGVEGTKEIVGFTPKIYKKGKVFILGPKVNAYEVVDFFGSVDRNEYANIQACGSILINGVRHLLAVCCYAIKIDGKTTYGVGVWTCSGTPQGDIYNPITNTGGWKNWSFHEKNTNSLPWFISPDSTYAVCSDGSMLSIPSLDNITYQKYTPPPPTTYSIECATGEYNWGFNYSNPKVISEAGASEILSMPIKVTGNIQKGKLYVKSEAEYTHKLDVRGRKPNGCGVNGFLLDGELWVTECPVWSTVDDPSGGSQCSSYPGGESVRITVTGHGAASGMVCYSYKFIPFKTGSWRRTSITMGPDYWSFADTNFPINSPPPHGPPGANKADGYRCISENGTQIVLEFWTYFGGGDKSPQPNCGYVNSDLSRFLAIEIIGSTISDWQYYTTCGAPDYIKVYGRGYNGYAKTGQATYTYMCS